MKVVVVGAGIIGMSLAYEWIEKNPNDEIVIIDKESHEAFHASGKNSGILHAGFYYNTDSLKAMLTAEGNKLMKEFCKKYNIPINETGKLVIAKNEDEIETLFELERRSKTNGAGAYIVTEEEAKKIDSNAKTYKYALYSPNTASVNPKEVCKVLRRVLEKKGVKFIFNMPFEKFNESYDFLINAAGLYADKIAHSFNISLEYTVLPFKGLYRKYTDKDKIIKTQIYPVPNIKNPFLGVHFSLMADETIKIGPTAIPAFWREHYAGFERFNLNEFLEILLLEMKMFFIKKYFRDLAIYEIKYYNPKNIYIAAKTLVLNLPDKFKPYTPGIRAQLVDKSSLELIMDFLVKYENNQIHILNAVSPAFTASFAFAKYVLDTYEKERK